MWPDCVIFESFEWKNFLKIFGAILNNSIFKNYENCWGYLLGNYRNNINSFQHLATLVSTSCDNVFSLHRTLSAFCVPSKELWWVFVLLVVGETMRKQMEENVETENDWTEKKEREKSNLTREQKEKIVRERKRQGRGWMWMRDRAKRSLTRKDSIERETDETDYWWVPT